MARKRRRFAAEFKARVALEALQERDSVQAIAARHELHPNQVSVYPCQPRVFLPCGRDGLGDPARPFLAAVQHDGHLVLHRGSG